MTIKVREEQVFLTHGFNSGPLRRFANGLVRRRRPLAPWARESACRPNRQ